jgi:hypothetical protein
MKSKSHPKRYEVQPIIQNILIKDLMLPLQSYINDSIIWRIHGANDDEEVNYEVSKVSNHQKRVP